MLRTLLYVLSFVCFIKLNDGSSLNQNSTIIDKIKTLDEISNLVKNISASESEFFDVSLPVTISDDVVKMRTLDFYLKLRLDSLRNESNMAYVTYSKRLIEIAQNESIRLANVSKLEIPTFKLDIPYHGESELIKPNSILLKKGKVKFRTN